MLSCQLCPIPRDPVDYGPPDSSAHFLGKNTGLHCNALPQGTFPNQGSNPCLPCVLHWQADSSPLSHLGSPLLKLMSQN